MVTTPKKSGSILTNYAAESGDLRSIISSINNLPQDFEGSCKVILNCACYEVAARNALMLLIARTYEPDIAAPMILHIWYSAFVTANIAAMIKKDLLPMIQDVLGKIADKPASSRQAKTWSHGNLSLVLTKEQWLALQYYFTGNAAVTADEARASRQKIMTAPSRNDLVERMLYCQPPGWRVAKMKFRQDDMLLPFGASRAEFDVPNP